MFEFTDKTIKATVEAIEFTRDHVCNSSIPKSEEVFNKLNSIALRLLSHSFDFRLSEIDRMCVSLDIYIKESGEATMVHHSTLNGLSSILRKAN